MPQALYFRNTCLAVPRALLLGHMRSASISVRVSVSFDSFFSSPCGLLLVAFIMQETKEGHTCGSWKHDSVVRLFDLSVKIWGFECAYSQFLRYFWFFY